MHVGALAKLIVYSLSLDGPVRSDNGGTPGTPSTEGFVAGSRALDSLEKLMTSIESFFHPSNYGLWSLNVRRVYRTGDIQRLTYVIADSLRSTPHGRVLQEMERRTNAQLQDPGSEHTLPRSATFKNIC